MSEKIEYFPKPEPLKAANLQIDVCGNNSILGSYHRAFTFKGQKPERVVVNIREVLPHVDLAAELASAREELELSVDQLVLGVVEHDSRIPVTA